MGHLLGIESKFTFCGFRFLGHVIKSEGQNKSSVKKPTYSFCTKKKFKLANLVPNSVISFD